MPDKVFDCDEAGACARQADEAAQRRWYHHQLPHDFAVILAAHIENQADALIWDEGKGMGRVQRLWCQHRQDLFLEIAFDFGLMGFADGGWFNNLYAFGGQFLDQFLPQFLLLGHQRIGCGDGFGKLFRRGAAIDGQFLDPPLLLPPQSGDPDHEKFIQIRARNGQETKTFQKRMRRICSFFEDPLVKFQPGKLAIEIAARGQVFLLLDCA